MFHTEKLGVERTCNGKNEIPENSIIPKKIVFSKSSQCFDIAGLVCLHLKRESASHPSALKLIRAVLQVDQRVMWARGGIE